MDAQELFDGSHSNPFTLYSDLKGKRVFVTGGGSGIGAYFVSAFAFQGATVGFLSLNPEPANALCDAIVEQTGNRPFYRSCDIRDVSSLTEALQDFQQEFGSIEVLVNNAARDDRIGLNDVTPDAWDDAMNTNLRPYIFAIQSVSEAMADSGKGAIVNISSNAPQLGIPGFPAYIASKSAISGMTKSLAQELGPSGIRVNSILPGWCLTERQKRLWLTEEGLEKTLERQAVKRMITGIDLANAALFLSSDAAAMITGVSLNVDAGIS